MRADASAIVAAQLNRKPVGLTLKRIRIMARLGLAAALLLVVPADILRAQTEEVSFALDPAIECFRRAALEAEPGAACDNGAASLWHVAHGWRDWDQATVGQVAEALISETASDNFRIASTAIYTIAILGLSGDGEDGRSGTVDLLEQAFVVTTTPSVVIDVAASQSERHEAVAFLTSVVRADSEREVSTRIKRQAAVALYGLGPDGAAALQSLRMEGLGDSAVSAVVERLSELGEH